MDLIAEQDGQRLDVFLAERAGMTRSAVQRLLEQGLVTCGGRPVRKKTQKRRRAQSTV